MQMQTYFLCYVSDANLCLKLYLTCLLMFYVVPEMPYLKGPVLFYAMSQMASYLWCLISNIMLCLMAYLKYPLLFDAISQMHSNV